MFEAKCPDCGEELGRWVAKKTALRAVERHKGGEFFVECPATISKSSSRKAGKGKAHAER